MLHVRSCVPQHNRIPLADWWKWSFRLDIGVACNCRLGSSTSGCAATSHIAQTSSFDIDHFITCSTVVLQCYRRQVIPMEQGKIRHSVTLYSLNRSFTKLGMVDYVSDSYWDHQMLIICPIAIAYSMGQIIKSVCVCLCVCVSVRLRALSRSHFLIDFHQNWHRRKNPEK